MNMKRRSSISSAISAIVLSAVGVAQAHVGDATWYNTGLGNCGAWSYGTEFIVAIPTQEYNSGHRCWQRIRASYQGRTIDATIVDSCPSCNPYNIDLSPAAFMALAPLATGRIHGVSWDYLYPNANIPESPGRYRGRS